MTVAATCATIAALLASAQGGETIHLKGDCPTIQVRKHYSREVTVDAETATVRGLIVSGGNLRWRGGTVAASGGAFAVGRPGYGILITGRNVTIEGVRITAAKKGIVLDQAANVTIARSRFWRLAEDGIIASRTAGLQVRDNRFEETIGKPSQCVAGGRTTYKVRRRDCAGVWTDGTHADAVQMRNGVKDALIEGNLIVGDTQGITQMDTTGDAPLERVVIRRNSILTTGYHPITLDVCLGCRIEGNDVHRAAGSAKRAVIIAGRATRCGNVAPDDRIRDRPC